MTAQLVPTLSSYTCEIDKKNSHVPVKKPKDPTSENFSDEVNITRKFLDLVEAGNDGDRHKLVRVHLGLQVLVMGQIFPLKKMAIINLFS